VNCEHSVSAIVICPNPVSLAHYLLCLSIYGSTVLLLDLGSFFNFLILYIVGRTPWTGDQHVARPLPTHRTTQTRNNGTQTCMPRVEFEPMIAALDQRKTVHTLRRAPLWSALTILYYKRVWIIMWLLTEGMVTIINICVSDNVRCCVGRIRNFSLAKSNTKPPADYADRTTFHTWESMKTRHQNKHKLRSARWKAKMFLRVIN
jgi:hypothetical protein